MDTDSAQQKAHRARHVVRVPGGDRLQVLRGRDHQHLDTPQRHTGLAPLFRRNHLQRVVDAMHALDIDVEAIEKNRVEHVADNLRERRRAAVLRSRRCTVVGLAHADHQQAIGAKVQGRADRRHLVHGPVAEMLAVDALGPKDKRDGRRCHQVVDGNACRASHAPRPSPGHDGIDTLVEGHRFARAVAGTGNAECAQVAGVDHVLDPLARHAFLQQLAQRRAVEQRLRVAPAETTEHEGGQPVRAGHEHTPGIGPEHLSDLEIAPHKIEALDRLAKAVRVDRQRRGIDGPGRGAGNHRERVGNVGWQDVGDGLEHADLIGRTRTAAQHDEADNRFVPAVRHDRCLLIRGSLTVAKNLAGRRGRTRSPPWVFVGGPGRIIGRGSANLKWRRAATIPAWLTAARGYPGTTRSDLLDCPDSRTMPRRTRPCP